MVLAFACALVLTAGEPGDGPLVPWFVPRSAMAGVFVNPPVVTPALRLGWEGTIVSQPRNDLMWIVNLGTGASLGTPAPMTALYQHVLLAGLGYRSDHALLHWGFQLTAGALWSRTAFLPGSIYRFESRVHGLAEGRVQLGVRLARHFILGLCVGYASVFVVRRDLPSTLYAGGFSGGLFVDWR